MPNGWMLLRKLGELDGASAGKVGADLEVGTDGLQIPDEAADVHFGAVLELGTNVYISEAKRRIIFAPLSWVDTGLLYEQGNPFVEDFNAPDKSLGAAIKRSLMMHARNAYGFKRQRSTEGPPLKPIGRGPRVGSCPSMSRLRWKQRRRTFASRR